MSAHDKGSEQTARVYERLVQMREYQLRRHEIKGVVGKLMMGGPAVGFLFLEERLKGVGDNVFLLDEVKKLIDNVLSAPEPKRDRLIVQVGRAFQKAAVGCSGQPFPDTL